MGNTQIVKINGTYPLDTGRAMHIEPTVIEIFMPSAVLIAIIAIC